ncbi:hypothetical protein [Paracoccus yeei]|uniref:Component of SufBCD complex n=1 Tax=Paracoccus yeei TaxID=147645 RepID=A0A5P2QUN6_9RHOB|nr:hypothetical protein [Paracoccus yeei]QEU09811.1 hypothetical protein FOB51_18375 [Paracoccus yeei]
MIQAILSILDSRSFGSIWFWLLLVLVWGHAGRRVLGVPVDIAQAARGGDEPAALLLLDWLSLTLPRWRMGPKEGAVLLGLGAFGLSALAVLGFGYGLEMAQALVLLALPLALLLALEVQLARRLSAIVAAAEAGSLPVDRAGRAASSLMRRHRRMVTLASVLAVAATAWRGALWLVAHPFGF